MRRTSKVFFLFVFTLALSALIASSALPASAQTLEWLNSPAKVPARITATPDDSVLTTLKGNLNPLATAKYDRGVVSDSLPMQHMFLLLQRSPEQQQMLTAVIDGQKNRRSELYHHWLTPVQFGSHFGPASSDIAVVTTWLQSHGFKIDEVTKGRTAVIFSGTAGQVRSAFHTEIHNLEVNGESHIANMTEPMIPAALAPVVRGFLSLNNFFPKPMLQNVSRLQRDPKTGKFHQVSGIPPAATLSTASRKPKSDITCPDCSGTGATYYLVGPQDFYTIYNENPLLAAGITGAGSTIAVIEETDVNPADVTSFRSQFALPAYATPPNSTQGGVNYLFGADGVFCTDPGILTDGEETEADVDVQWAGTTAPNAIVDFVSCATTSTTSGIFLSAQYIIDDLAPQSPANPLSPPVSAMSLSYGECEYNAGSSNTAAVAALWEQAAAQGQTVSVSSGDSGSLGCDQDSLYATSAGGASVNSLGSSIYNVAAGGTDFSDYYSTSEYTTAPNTWWNTAESSSSNGYSSALSYVPEVPWGGYCSNNLTVSFWEYLGLCAEIGLCGATPEALCNTVYTTGYYEFGYAEPVGGGGGVSVYNNIPTWQAVYGVGAAGNNTSTAFRNLPDISMFASSGWWYHALVFCQSDAATCSNYDSDGLSLAAGGTSFVAPQIAGLMGLVVQATGANQGPANYNLYGLAAQEYGVPGGTFGGAACSGSGLGAGVGSNCIFQDIAADTPCIAGTTCNADGVTVTGSNEENCETGSSPSCFTATAGDFFGESAASATSVYYPASQGYDAATGLGSVNINNLVTQWQSLSTLWATDTSLTANPTTISGAQTTALTASVATTGRGGFVAPIGSVTYYLGSVGGTNIGSALLSSVCTGTPPTYSCSPGTATLNAGTDLFQLGANSVIAYFPGDGANDASSYSAPVTVTVTQLATTTTVTSSLNPSVYGQAVTFTATITPVSTPGPTGTVEFQANGVDIVGCSAVAVSSATAQCVSGGATLTNGLPVGTNAIVAIYSGDSNYVGSTSNPLSQVVTPAVLTVTGNPASMTYGGAIPAFSATISGFVNGDTVSVVSGTPSLVVNCSVGMIRKKVTPQPTCLFPVGSYPIVAAQGTLAAANYTFTFVNGTLTVTQASSTAALASSPNPSVLGQSVAFTASVAPATAGSNGLAPTGTVEFQANGADISGCSAVATTYGVAVCTTTALPVGTNAITAIYSGDSNYLTSTSTSLSQVVTAPALIPTATAFSAAAPNPATVGQTVTFTASVGPILTPAPTGTVTFLSGGAAISDCSTPVPLSSGMATCATTALTATTGTYSITAVY
ncbi:MAG: Ig-like domain repeat protein, partial [Terriglobales bacterium]